VRLARSLALTIREQDYIVAARALGSGQLRVMARHVFPNAPYALVVVGTLYIATAIRTEASLSFLGLGIPPPTPSWGNILSEGRQYIKCCPWITTFSGLAIMLAVLAFNLVGDALREPARPPAPRRIGGRAGARAPHPRLRAPERTRPACRARGPDAVPRVLAGIAPAVGAAPPPTSTTLHACLWPGRRVSLWPLENRA
jgi:hypothetical protein